MFSGNNSHSGLWVKAEGFLNISGRDYWLNYFPNFGSKPVTFWAYIQEFSQHALGGWFYFNPQIQPLLEGFWIYSSVAQSWVFIFNNQANAGTYYKFSDQTSGTIPT
jgi:hypothetical protein